MELFHIVGLGLRKPYTVADVLFVTSRTISPFIDSDGNKAI